MARVQVVQQQARVQRKPRSPKHSYYISHRPFQITPFMIAPVLPGETLKNLNVQGRAISDPLAVGMGNILPWWHEFFFFYVKLRDLDARDDIEQMFLQGTAISSLVDATADGVYFHTRGVPWAKMCLKRIVEEYFRNEGESWTAASLDGLPVATAYRPGTSGLESMLVGATPTNPNYLTNPEGNTDVRAGFQEAYERMRAMRYTEVSFEEFLSLYGVEGMEVREENKPELLRYTSNWTYPTNMVEPSTGVPSGAASWSLNERADKDRFFSEPGFIIGVTVCRPKIYMGNQTSSLSNFLVDPYLWLNPLARDHPEMTVREFVGPTAPDGPLSSQTLNYGLDMRDLFIHGDQWINNADATPGPSGGYAPALPTAAGEMRFVNDAMVDALFVAGASSYIRQDGLVQMTILSNPTTSIDNT